MNKNLSRALPILTVACIALVTACGGGDDDTASEATDTAVPDDGSSSVDPGDDSAGGGSQEGQNQGEADIPDVDACALAADTIRARFGQVSGQEPTTVPSSGELGGPRCAWSGAGSSLELTVSVSSYDDFFDQSMQQTVEATPVTGLGDEAFMADSLLGTAISWRRDAFSVYLEGSSGFTPDELTTYAHQIDGQMPG